MTELDYIKSKLTPFDTLCGHSIWPPVAFIMAMIVLAAYEAPFTLQRPLLIGFLISFVVAIALRTRLSNRIAEFKNQYQKLYR
jgi:hypothetical protein